MGYTNDYIRELVSDAFGADQKITFEFMAPPNDNNNGIFDSFRHKDQVNVIDGTPKAACLFTLDSGDSECNVCIGAASISITPEREEVPYNCYTHLLNL